MKAKQEAKQPSHRRTQERMKPMGIQNRIIGKEAKNTDHPSAK